MTSTREVVRVLVVGEDLPAARQSGRLLEELDDEFRVTVVRGAGEALEALAAGQFACLVSDHGLWDVDGVQLLEIVRARAPTLPFILVGDDATVASAAASAQVDDVVEGAAGPDAIEDLARRIRAAVDRNQAVPAAETTAGLTARILETAPDGIVVTVEDDVVYANHSARRLFGVDEGCQLPDSPERWLGEDRTAVTGDGQLAPATLQRWSGTIQTAESESVPIELASGTVEWEGRPGVVYVLRESPDEREDEQPSSDDILDAVSAAIFVKDTDGAYLRMNDRCREVLDVADENVGGMTDEDLFPPSVASRIRADDRQVVRAGETVEFEESVPSSDGERTLLTRKTPLVDGDGDVYAVCGVATDITEQKRRERALQERVKELSVIHETIELFQSRTTPVPALLQTFVTRLPESFQYPATTEASLVWGDLQVETEDYERTESSLSRTAETVDGPPVHLSLVRTGREDGESGGPFIAEERDLVDTLTAIVAGYLQRREYISELERYETTLRALGDPVYALDAEGNFTFVNDALVAESGYDREELLGKHTSHLLRMDDVERGEDVIVELLRSRDTQTAKWEMELLPASGDPYPVENHLALLPFGEDGEFRGTAGVIRDISERVQREQELERRRDLHVRTEEMVDVGGWEVNLDTDELYWTEGTYQIHEVPDSYEPSIEEGLDFYHPDDRDELRNAIDECCNEGYSYDLELRLVTAEGRECWVRTRGERVVEDGVPKLRGTIQDVTEIREHEQQLGVLNRILRHNLRNNLNVVTANAELLREQLGRLEVIGDLSEATREDLDAAALLPEEDDALGADERRNLEESLEAMLSYPIAESLENLSRLEANAWELLSLAEKSRKLAAAIDHIDSEATVEIGSLLDSQVQEYRLANPEATINFDGGNWHVDANPASTRLVVSEVLENALKHTDADAPTVEIETTRTAQHRVRISIRDDGPGIPDVEREAITAGTETALQHSSGVGLWTVNWLLGRLGGGMHIDADTTAGTTVHLELPIAADKRYP